MSTITGQVSEKKKSGMTRKVKASRIKLPPKKAAKFMKDFRALLKRHKIPAA